MKIDIVDSRVATPEEWDHIWNNCEYATYFHSRQWAEIWQRHTKGRIKPAPRLVVFSDGKKALLPFSVFTTLLRRTKKYLSSPAGTFGGWISTDQLQDQHLEPMLNFISNEYKNLTWRLNPYDVLNSKVKVEPLQPDSTHVLNLKQNFSDIYKSWTKGHKSAVTKAIREGIAVTIARDLQDWKNYFKIYSGSLKKWGKNVTSKYTFSLFEIMFGLDSPYIKLWLAKYRNQAVSGALCFYSKKHVVYWHGASSAQYTHLRPANLLLYEIIKDSESKNYLWFDFNPSGGHEGVANFKKSFGTTVKDCPIILRDSR